MIASKLTRVAHRAPAVVSVSTTSSTTVHRTPQCIAGRRPHQRRHSSSKASCPPDRSPSGGKPTPSSKTTTTTSSSTTTTTTSETASSKSPISDTSIQRGGKRLSRSRRPRDISIESEDRFAGLPSVPTTQHLHHSDISTSSFFSLHRPLSIATTFPPPSTAQVFDSIFQSQHKSDPWENGNSAERRPEDVIYTLHDTLDAMEPTTNANGESSMRWEVIQESQGSQDGVKHLDGAPIKSLDELVAQFKPFLTPPPPQAFLNDSKVAPPKEKRSSKESKSQQLSGRLHQQLQRQPRQKSYTTTIIVTESTGEDGQRTYTASSSPIVRIPTPEDVSSIGETQLNNGRFPFRERMQQRQQEYVLRRSQNMQAPSASRTYVRRAPVARRPKMLLISVKRQRKLKMKKHKYKKLMRRTRNLRRRLDKV